ncbi:2-dehydropantoate 2-reductase [Parahaliea mediterranea]|uniref:2-dehydropantoate 2-reductase n=1 Tax=Parahaliea mediterranea TaxID=651086 RepID=A0A939DC31_9GAMM|nr:2-dehydropantoate 2-reductase [Parahaliea mediterranea]MBN7795411.1 2-dehydropantoate 2-reductase [Parahaliea mediterranea]
MPAHWHILGTGAMGCLFASYLARQRIPLTLLPRQPAEPGDITLVVDGLGGGHRYQLPWETAGSDGPISHLLVTTKAYDVAPAVASVAHRLRPDTVVLLMANGIGFEREVRARVPGLAPTLGTTTEGAYREARWRVRHAGRGATRIGLPGGAGAPAWFANWRAAVPDCHWDMAIEQALWRKLAINCAINPLTALHGCANGQLGADPGLAAQVRALCAEIERIGIAAGQASAVTDLEAAVFAVIAGTADNQSSMLQDVRAGRRTEIDYITGHLLATATAHGLDAPRNRELMDKITAQEPSADA